MSDYAAVLADNDALREQLDALARDLSETLADNELMGRVFDADDRIAAALAEAARYRALAENAERTLAMRTNEFNERARDVAYWKNRAQRAEKSLQKKAA